MNRIFNRVHAVHLEYLALTIEKYGHAILHGDGNIYVDVEGVQREHQRSFIAKTFAGVGNEAAQYRIKFTSVDEIPGTVEELEKMLMDAKAKEAFEDGKIELTDNFKSIGGKKAASNDTSLAEAEAAKKAAEDAAAEAKAEAEAAKKAAEDAKTEAELQAEENAKLKAELAKLQKAAKKDAQAEADAAKNEEK